MLVGEHDGDIRGALFIVGTGSIECIVLQEGVGVCTYFIDVLGVGEHDLDAWGCFVKAGTMVV